MATLNAFGIGLPSAGDDGVVLDCWFPAPVRQPDSDLADAIRNHCPAGVSWQTPEALEALVAQWPENAGAAALQALLDADRQLLAVRLDTDGPIESTAEAYLKLHLLSHRLVLPNQQNLDGIFAQLPNLAWTSEGPIQAAQLPARVAAARIARRHLEVFAIDKFPRMTNYVIPSGVRIADASRIRLGAYLGDGTTVMHEGFVNFNAGCIGPNMVEGRISQGVVLGAHTDLGGGASTMGTLSGGGNIRISIGEHCLIGANAGTGIPLGDRCTIEAGLYITAGTPVTVLDENQHTVANVKARDLAGGSDLLFIRNGRNGAIECRTNRQAIELNAQLHAHN
jgi:2,3,4,5-tetrahydropyridine-2-carboxylate N-succinyltransferase